VIFANRIPMEGAAPVARILAYPHDQFQNSPLDGGVFIAFP
jgi:hypothetical protein